jgi:transposase
MPFIERIMNGEPATDCLPVRQLVHLARIGGAGATVLVAEVFHRLFQNRKHLASYLGLAPGSYPSGDRAREQDISKAGNKPARTSFGRFSFYYVRNRMLLRPACRGGSARDGDVSEGICLSMKLIPICSA